MTQRSADHNRAAAGDQVLGVVMRPEGLTVDDRIFMRRWLRILVAIGVLISPLAMAGVLLLNRFLDYAALQFVN